MKTYKFYVVAKTAWINDYWKPVVGPFPNKPTAEAAREAYEDAHATTDIKYQQRTRVASRTKLTTVYGCPVGAVGDADIAEEIERAQEG